MTPCILQLPFFFYRLRPNRADFSGGRIISDAGLLPLRAFDHRYRLTASLAKRVRDLREDERVCQIHVHPSVVVGPSWTQLYRDPMSLAARDLPDPEGLGFPRTREKPGPFSLRFLALLACEARDCLLNLRSADIAPDRLLTVVPGEIPETSLMQPEDPAD